MLWILLVPLALAGRWDGVDADVEAWRVVPAEPEQVWEHLADTHTLEQLFPHECAQDWVHGEVHAGIGATASLTYRWDVVRRRLAATITEGREGAWFDLEHAGNKGFTTRFTTEAAEGGTKVTLHSYVAAPPWPVKGRYYLTIQPIWAQCYVDALEALDQRLSQQPSLADRPPAPPPPGAAGGLHGPPTPPSAVVWTSGSCPPREYQRDLTLTPDFRYQGMDLVSPCPPNARCVWSGVVHFSGTWAMDEGDLVLTELQADEGPGALPRPARLRGEGGVFYEGECAYEKGVPPSQQPAVPVKP